ncbi:MAG: flavodoxin, partial [Firmicutes bacterium]|nr:flavodoxin [Bacillota bacterium]
FSESGYTYAAAVKLSVGCKMDICKIIPSLPYSKNDLDVENLQSRADLEAKNPDARPDILELTLDISKYEVILLGFPIWFEDMPKVIYTFLERYNLAGKVIVPFATSKESTLENITDKIKSMCPNSTVCDGIIVVGCPSDKELKYSINRILQNR